MEKQKLKYVIVRTYSAGVHAGELETREGKEVVLISARRFWSWAGALSLNELAAVGPALPAQCKFSVVVSRILLTEATEIIDVSDEARRVIEAVPPWSAK